MSSRRIGSFTNLSPIQELAINPFSTFNSDSVNKLTRTLSNGKDGVCFGLNVKNSNHINDVVDNIVIFKSGDIFKQENWIFDSDFTLIKSSDNTKLDGIRLNSVLEYKCLSFSYIIKPSDYKLINLIGNDINTRIKFVFNISIGCPKRIIFSTNDSNIEIDYPKTKESLITLEIPHNLKYDNNTDGIKLTCSILMDPNDTDDRVNITSVYNGQSYFQLDNFNFNIDILNKKTYINDIAYISLSHNYSNFYIHPTQCLYVTPGIAIKDDLMLDFKKNQLFKLESVKLDLNNNTSWLKNNPFVVHDFYMDGAEQYAYVYNNKNRSTPLKLTGAINDSTGKLNFWYGDITSTSGKDPILLMDEYELSNHDEELDFDIIQVESTNNYIFKIKEHSITNNHKELYGEVAYLVDKRYNVILHKFNLNYDDDSFKYPQQEVTFDLSEIKLDKDLINKDNLKIVASIGPIKVSGDITKINQNMIRWANVVIYYTYFKHPRPNKAYIGLIRDEDLKDKRYREDYIVIARVRFVSSNTVDLISYENRQEIFTYHNLARNINYKNELDYDELNLWVNPYTNTLDIPNSVSDALTKLIEWLNFKHIQSDWNQTDTTKPDFIKNKPDIPALQVQSDWNQTDTTKPDFIKNKPDISKEYLINILYPIGTIYITLDPRDPYDILGYGCWEKISQGRCLFGAKDDNSDLGTTLNSKLPNIKGSLSNDSDSENLSFNNQYKTEGCITASTSIGSNYNKVSTTNYGINEIKIDASKHNSIYSDDAKIVQPPALVVNIWKRVECTERYTVKFLDWDDTLIQKSSVMKDHDAIPPENPTRTGYKFVYWNGNYKNVQKDEDVIATYSEIIKYLVTFETNGGSKINSQEVESGNKATRPQNPTKVGHTFINWYSDISLINIYNFDNLITENTTLYASWYINQYTIKFETNGGTAIDDQKVEYNNTVAKPKDPTKSGSTFSNWYSDSTLTNIYDFNTLVTDDKTLYAGWDISNYLITFNSNGGTYVSPQTVAYNSKVTKPSNPTKYGSTFVRWNTDNTLLNEYDFNTLVTENKTLYASWNLNSYTVKFESNGGSYIQSQNVKYNNKATRPTDPTKDHYTFVNWYSDSTLKNIYNFDTLITQNKILYACWKEINYIVKFESNGGTSVADQTVAYNNKATKPTDPQRVNYTFVNWYSDESLTNQYDFNTLITGNKTLYAKWNYIDPVKVYYTVSFDSNGGTSISDQKIESGNKATRPIDPTKDHYTFVNWYSDNTLKNIYDFNTLVTENKTLYAGWNIDTYTVKFESNGGTSVADQIVAYNNKATKPTDPTKDHYTFVNWYSDSTLTNIYDFDTLITENKTLYAKYNPVNYTIRFFSNGGTSIADQKVAYNNKGVKPTDPTRTGYIFVNWYSDESLTNEYDFNTLVTHDINVYAKWQIFNYIVKFESNGGTSVADQTVIYNSKCVKPTDPTRTGYTFVNWYSDKSLTNQYDFNTLITENKTLYARWKEINYTVKFESNGGTSVADQTVAYNNKATKPTDPTRTGYIFVNWYSDESLTNEYDFDTLITENKTLYAGWNIDTYTVKFESNGGTSVADQTVIYNSKCVKPTDPTRTGYTFVNWYSDSTLTNIYDFDTLITENKTLYAGWNINTYTVKYYVVESQTEPILTQSVKYGDIPSYKPELLGWEFKEWLTKSGDLYGNPITQNSEYTAFWIKEFNNKVFETTDANPTKTTESIGPKSYCSFYELGNINNLALPVGGKVNIYLNYGLFQHVGSSTAHHIIMSPVYMNKIYTYNSTVLPSGYLKTLYDDRSGTRKEISINYYISETKKNYSDWGDFAPISNYIKDGGEWELPKSLELSVWKSVPMFYKIYENISDDIKLSCETDFNKISGKASCVATYEFDTSSHEIKTYEIPELINNKPVKSLSLCLAKVTNGCTVEWRFYVYRLIISLM